MMGCSLRMRLVLAWPDIATRVRDQHNLQKTQHHTDSRNQWFVLGQKVWGHKMRKGRCWIPGIIAGILGPVSYQVQVDSGTVLLRHVDHI